MIVQKKIVLGKTFYVVTNGDVLRTCNGVIAVPKENNTVIYYPR